MLTMSRMLSAVTINLEGEHLVVFGLVLLVALLWIVRRALKRGAAADADFWGRSAAAAVLVLGLVVVVLPAVSHLTLKDDPFSPPVETRTVTKTEADGKVSKEVTQSPASQTLVERGLAQGGLVFLRLGVVVLAAFLAGAFVQRFVLAEFAVEVGGLKLPALAQTATSLDQATVAFKKQDEKLRSLSAATEEGLRDLARVTASSLDSVHESLASQHERLNALTAEVSAALRDVSEELERVDDRLRRGNL